MLQVARSARRAFETTRRSRPPQSAARAGRSLRHGDSILRTRVTMSRPRILDPQAIPVVGTDQHLLALDPSRLTAPALRQRFDLSHAWQP